MYNLKITNNYIYECGFKGSTGNRIFIIEPGKSEKINNLGNGILNVHGQGSVNFIDLADYKIPGYESIKEYWGVLIRTHTIEGYYRYEGGGDLQIVNDKLGSYELSTKKGTLVPISLPELTIKDNH